MDQEHERDLLKEYISKVTDLPTRESKQYVQNN